MATNSGDYCQVSKTILQCNKHMLERAICSDVLFELHSPDGATKEFPIHKYMLVLRSPVFEAQFCGGLSEQSNKIIVTDVEPEAFGELLKYIYYEEPDITTDNVFLVLHAARKYFIDPLIDKCIRVAKKMIFVDKVCTILDQAIRYDLKTLIDECMQFIITNCRSVIKTEGFESLSSNALTKILDSDRLLLSEIDLFKACIKWAKRISSDNAADDELRQHLTDCLRHIRFTSMTAEEFARNVGEMDILTDEEKSAIYHYLLIGTNSEHLTDLGFTLKRRCPELRCSIYKTPGEEALAYTDHEVTITFAVSHPIILLGVSLFGGRDQDKHAISLGLWHGYNTLVTEREHILHSDGRNTPYPIYLEARGFAIKPRQTYRICIYVSGPNTYRCDGCVGDVIIDGIRFKFTNCKESVHSRKLKKSPVAELLFRRALLHEDGMCNIL